MNPVARLLAAFLLLPVSCLAKQIDTSSSPLLNSLAVTGNPFGIAPLTAVIDLSSRQPVRVSITIKGKRTPLGDITNDFNRTAANHSLPVLGLYAGHDNRIELRFFDDDGLLLETFEFSLTTFSARPALPQVRIDEADLENMLPGMTLVSAYGHSSDAKMLPMRAFMFDEFGDIRWYLDTANHSELKDLFFSCGPERLQNGNLYFGSFHTDAIFEMNLLGKIINRWPLEPYEFHHQVMEMPNGNFLLTSGVKDADTTQDFVIEVDRRSGEVVTAWDLNLSLENTRNVQGNNEKNWFHGNAVAYDAEQDAILVSGRFQGLVKLTSDNKIAWLMSPHEGWTQNGRGEEIDDFLLQPLDQSGKAITDSKTLTGHRNHPEFEWN